MKSFHEMPNSRRRTFEGRRDAQKKKPEDVPTSLEIKHLPLNLRDLTRYILLDQIIQLRED